MCMRLRTPLCGGGGVVRLRAPARPAAQTPAPGPGAARVGGLEVGRRADVVITDSRLRVIEVLRAGTVFHP